MEGRFTVSFYYSSGADSGNLLLVFSRMDFFLFFFPYFRVYMMVPLSSQRSPVPGRPRLMSRFLDLRLFFFFLPNSQNRNNPPPVQT